MRSVFALCLALISSLMLTSCSINAADNNKTQNSAVSDAQTKSETVTKEAQQTSLTTDDPAEAKQKARRLQEKYGLSEDTYPDTECAFSSVPVSAGLRSVYLGLPALTAEAKEVYSSDEEAFNDLINNKTDAVFIHELSDEQKSDASEADFNPESIPVTREALVFMVSRENQIDSLSGDTIRKIYSGEITNWQEVGGADEEIDAYQRCTIMPAHKKMLKFMGDTALSEPPTEIMDINNSPGAKERIPEYINTTASIGYAVYSEELEDYYEASGIKLISVDGVKPDTQSIQSQKYPLTETLFYTYSADEPDDSPVRKLGEFISSDDGKDAVMSSVINKSLSHSKGTGPEGVPQKKSELTVYTAHPEIVNISDTDIREYLAQWNNELPERTKGCITVINGYLFAYSDDSNFDCDTFAESAIFDLYTGCQLQFSDLFYRDTDYIEYYNKQIAQYLHNTYLGFTDEVNKHIAQKREFCGVTDDCIFAPTGRYCQIYVPEINPYFTGTIICSLPQDSFFYSNSIVFREPRDMNDLFTGNVDISSSMYDASSDDEFTYGHHEQTGGVRMNKLLDRSTVLDDQKITQINQIARDMVNDSFVADICRNTFGRSLTDAGNLYGPMFYNGYAVDVDVYKDKNIFTVTTCYLGSKADPFHPAIVYVYDLNNLGKLTNKQTLKKIFGGDYTEYTNDKVDDSDLHDDTCYVSHLSISGGHSIVTFADTEDDRGLCKYWFEKIE
ncbi:MAG: substrate-binding domain-containing protein [Oscillospiraceae bacterium]|nr:substrate-binding domain-containing protein [Oscillospiraceae bacterium]